MRKLHPGKLHLLAVRQVQTLGEGDHGDGGGGLILRVKPDGSAQWVFRFTAASGKRREMGLVSTPRRIALYARVSTDRQTTENQLRELREAARRLGWEVAAEFRDQGISGANGRKDRPQLDALLRGISRREFDVVAAWSVDRLGRSLGDLVGLLQELQATGVDLYLHQQGINTTTPAGKALFQMMGVFAEVERELIRERVTAGLARAKAKGTKSGNPIGRPLVGADVEQRIRELRSQGLGIVKVAKMIGCGVSVVQRGDAAAA